MVDLNKQKSLFFMELFLYLIFLDLDKMDIYRDNTRKKPHAGNLSVQPSRPAMAALSDSLSPTLWAATPSEDDNAAMAM